MRSPEALSRLQPRSRQAVPSPLRYRRRRYRRRIWPADGLFRECITAEGDALELVTGARGAVTVKVVVREVQRQREVAQGIR